MEKNRNNNERKICVYHYTVQYFFCSKCDLRTQLKSPSVVVGKLITNTKALMLGRTHLRRDPPRTKSIKSYEGGGELRGSAHLEDTLCIKDGRQ